MKDIEEHPRVYTQTYGIVGAILEQDGKILLVQEAQGFDKGKWNQPAGWVDPGEDPIASVKREVKEETGLEFEPENIVGIYSIVKKRLAGEVQAGIPHGFKIIYRGTFTETGSGLEEDVAAINWFTPEDIYEMESDTLRDLDIKQEVRDYLAGNAYPLGLVHHTVQE